MYTKIRCRQCDFGVSVHWRPFTISGWHLYRRAWRMFETHECVAAARRSELGDADSVGSGNGAASATPRR